MSDHDPTLTPPRSLAAELLASARDDAPPPELLDRTLAHVGLATAAAATAASAMANGGNAMTSGGSAMTSGASAMTAAGGSGLLGAIATGVVAGLLAVAIAHQVLPPVRTPQSTNHTAANTASLTNTLSPANALPPTNTASPANALPPTNTLSPANALSPTNTASPSAPSVHPATGASGLAPNGASALAAELALIDTARAALASGDHVRALAALDRHAREFPSGQLAHEAGVLRAEATLGSSASGASAPGSDPGPATPASGAPARPSIP